MARSVDDESYGFYTGDSFDPLDANDYNTYRRRASDGENSNPDDGEHPQKDKDKNKHKGKDKDKGKGKGKDTDPKPDINITRKLVRNEDGTVGVVFVDMETGRVVDNPYGDRKDIWTAQSDLRDILKDAGLKGRQGGKDRGGNNNQPAGPQEIDGYRFVGYDNKGNPKYVPINGGSVDSASRSAPEGFTSSPITPSSPSSANVSGFTTPDEQGDTSEDTAFDPMSGLRDPAKDPDYQVNGKFDPAGIPERDFQSEVAAKTKTNAYDTNLSETDYQYADGNNPHSLEGKNIDAMKSFASERNWDEATIEKAARTLAGELGPDVDLNTPEGQQEARAILSTIENRDIANGPQKTAIDAITAPSQYSTWNDERAAKVANTNYSLKADEFNKTVQDYLADPNSNLGFTSYHAPYVNPAWSDEMQDVQEIGGHKFGTLPEYTTKMAKYDEPMTDVQKAGLTTDVINQGFKQGFAYPASYDLVNNQPQIDLTGVNDMATGISAQRDYVAPQAASMAEGIQAQRDYNAPQQIKENTPIGVFEGAQVDPTATINNQISMDNGFAIQQGNQIAGIPPTVAAPTEMATRGLPPAVDIGGQIYTPDEGLSTNSFSTRAPTQEDVNRGFVNATGKSEFDPSFTEGLMGPNNSVVPSAVTTQSFTPQDKALGFGDYVSVDPNVGQIDAAQGATQTGRINGLYENENVGMLDTANQMANTAPTISSADAVASQTAASDPTSAGAGSDTPSVSTGVSTSSVGGFTSASHDATTSTSSTAGTTDATATGTSGFGGFTSIDADVEGDDGY